MRDVSGDPRRWGVLVASTGAFTLLFAVWLMLGVLGVPVQKELGLTDAQLGRLGAAAILAGSLPRPLFGVWADRAGGRRVMALLLFATAVPTFLVSRATSYEQLLGLALGFGLAGNAFSVGIAWNAAWFPRGQQGMALGVFGAGNVGAAVTKLLFGLFGAALLAAIPVEGLLGGLLPGGWRFYPAFFSILLVVFGAAVWLLMPRPDRAPAAGRSLGDILAPVKYARVWEYGLQYVVVFGAYVALSLVLPKYYVAVYGNELRAAFDLPDGAEGATAVLRAASLLTALFIFPASLLRPLGGWLSDKCGAVPVMGAVFAVLAASSAALALPVGLGVWPFTAALLVLGVGMGVGKAAVYKLIPDHFPNDVGAVGGLVGCLGALGGFVLPLAGPYLVTWTGAPQAMFLLLAGLVFVSAGWFAVSQLAARSQAARPAELVAGGVSA